MEHRLYKQGVNAAQGFKSRNHTAATQDRGSLSSRDTEAHQSEQLQQVCHSAGHSTHGFSLWVHHAGDCPLAPAACCATQRGGRHTLQSQRGHLGILLLDHKGLWLHTSSTWCHCNTLSVWGLMDVKKQIPSISWMANSSLPLPD